MANRNIDASIRKPRRAKGTPFYKLRNYYALGALGLSALTAVAYEFWGESQKLKKSLEDGKFDYPKSLKEQILEFQWGGTDPAMHQALQKIKEKKQAEIETPQPQSKLSKLFTTVPDV